MESIIRLPGRWGISTVRYFGQLAQLAGEVFSALFVGKLRIHLVAEQIVRIGFGTQPVIVITGAFTGAVFAAQSYFQFNEFGIESSVGALISIAMCRELGPVLTGLMVAGRVGAAMAAEIGTMKVTEQIDALRALAVHPVDYLVIPRVLGIMISMPLLIAESIVFGIFASWVICVPLFKVPHAWFMRHLVEHTAFEDIFIGMVKGFVFGILIVIISCHQGLHAKNGAVGVGKGTTTAVVNSSLALLIVNLFLTFLLNYFFPLGASS